jgi:protein-S-isoprenylcysteine O-methyltransferase Ste14
MIGAPSFSFYYTGVFMLVPFLWFIAGSEKEYKWTDIIYLLGFVAVLAPIPITYGDIHHTSVINVNLQIVGVAMLVMAVWGFIDSVIDMMDRIAPKAESKEEAKTAGKAETNA